MNTMKKLFLCVFCTIAINATAQDSMISNIHDIEPIGNHYKALQRLSPEKRVDFSSMDTIAYPTDKYLDFLLVYALNQPKYLTEGQVNFLSRSVAFPANSSEQTRAELDFLLDLQNKRTESGNARVLQLAGIGYWPHKNYTKTHRGYSENESELFFMAEEVMGKNKLTVNYPKTLELLKGVMNDTRHIEFAIKFDLLRARPYHLDTNIKPLREIPTPSFPSGHTLWAYIQAFTLSELIPEKRDEFIGLAYEIGLSREIMGVHFPSDEETARQITHRMLTLMWHTEKFQNDFNAAKEEWN
ncbi:MAG: phosphatase PAP2 family protein [Bacteroidota bacterium]